MENKKTLIISIVGILVLVIAVIGISFAAFTYAATGTKTNLIRTGSITLDVGKAEGNSFVFDGTYPMTDSKGVSLTENRAEVAVSSSWPSSAPMTIKYDLGIEIVSEGATLKSNYIKVALVDSTGKVLVGQGSGTNLTGGVTISSLASTKGPNNLITTYGLTGGTISASGTTDRYTIMAWVSEEYDLPVDKTNTTTDNSGNNSITSGLHKKQTGSETYKFKVKVIGTQVTGGESTSQSNAVYSYSTGYVNLGVTKDSIIGYTNDYTTLGKNYFLKHNLASDNTVESQEACYLLNGNQYCLKGCSLYNSDEEMCEVTNFEENVAILLESFGADNCSVNSNDVRCSASGLYVGALDDGLAYASGDSEGCDVRSDGVAFCGGPM